MSSGYTPFSRMAVFQRYRRGVTEDLVWVTLGHTSVSPENVETPISITIFFICN